MKPSQRIQILLRIVMPPMLAILIVAVLALVHLKRHFDASQLSGDSLDTLQAIRYFARTGQFGTLVIRPLLSGFIPFRPDSSQPDIAHAPLYTIFAGLVMKLQHQTGAGSGDQPAILATLAAWSGSIVAVFLLARRLFAGNMIAALAATIYALGSKLGLSTALLPHPATLAAFLFPLLFLALALLDQKNDEPPLSTRAAGFWTIVAGLIFGLLIMTAYSTLILLPLLLWHLWRIMDRSRRLLAIAVFLAAFLVIISPYLWRNYMLTRNPLFNPRTIELIMHTSTYPGYELYRSAVMNQSVGQFLTSGGFREVTIKAAGNLLIFTEQLPLAIGILLMTLALGAGLIRFDDSRTNRLRHLAYLSVAFHCIGLSFFQPAKECIPLLLMHQAVAAVFATGFLFAIVRARSLRRFHANLAIFGWTALTCLPGILVYMTPPNNVPHKPWQVFLMAVDESNQIFAGLAPMRSRQALLVAESPWEWAFRCDVPTVWLPRDSGDLQAVEARSQRSIGAIVLTPSLVKDYAQDSAAVSWVTTYHRLSSLWEVSTPLEGSLRRQLASSVKLFYPDNISTGLATYRPEPYSESNDREYTFILWNPKVTGPRRP